MGADASVEALKLHDISLGGQTFSFTQLLYMRGMGEWCAIMKWSSRFEFCMRCL